MSAKKKTHGILPKAIVNVWRRFVRLLAKAAKNNKFRRYYMFGSLGLLGLTTIAWAAWGANVQLHNADQLSDLYLFSSWQTFHGAQFPAAHTFLLKWPIFALLQLCGARAFTLMLATVVLAFATVFALAYLLYRIDRRPLVFGTVCLGLALALLLIPPQAYDGALLPVNLAMLTTRNIEYIVYIIMLTLFIQAKSMNSRRMVAAVLLCVILVASDRLFLALSVGGAIVALGVYFVRKNQAMVLFALRWLVGSVLGGAGATVLLWLISANSFTGFANTTAATPYSLISGAKELVLGCIYAILGLLTNMGANPVFDNRLVGHLPSELLHKLSNPAYLVYAVSFAICAGALYLAFTVVRSTLKPRGKAKKQVPAATALAISLLCSTVVAIALFIGTNHYYAVDARYLGIGFFALAVSASVGLAAHKWRQPKKLLLVASVILVAICVATPLAWQTARQQTRAYESLEIRNEKITDKLRQQPVDVLVGDYWRVLPIKRLTPRITVTPLTSCLQPASVLTSNVWQLDRSKQSFAYLLTLDGSLTNYPKCNYASVTKYYGNPDKIQLIAGTGEEPKELLLFYAKQDRKGSSPHHNKAASNLLTGFANFNCPQPTLMNIVAHEDDDLLFMSPDLLHAIDAGQCVRTVFLTAGDAGQDAAYWLSRQRGSEAAYATMTGSKGSWYQKNIQVGPKQYVTVAQQNGNRHISLIFFNLPDGGIRGRGYMRSGRQSLADLENGKTYKLRTVDGKSTYTSAELTSAIQTLMDIYKPRVVHTQSSVTSALYPDHSDHGAAGKYAAAAFYDYVKQAPATPESATLTYYVGYPIHGYPANLSGTDLSRKEAAFVSYSQHDGSTCHNISDCTHTPTYGAYLLRQYTDQQVPATSNYGESR